MGKQQDDGRTVLVRVGAQAAELPPLRLVAGDLATRADFDLDAVADLRLAVDEAAAELVAVAAPDSQVTCTFVLDRHTMRVTASVSARPDAVLRQDTFGWRVLSTLVDEAIPLRTEDGGTPVLGITLCKRRVQEAGAVQR